MDISPVKTKRIGNRMRIVHAPREIAGQMGILASALRKLGHQAHAISFSGHEFGYEGSKILWKEVPTSSWIRRTQRLNLFLALLAEYDVFHFHFGLTIMPHFWDLPVLAATGKRMAMHFWGSDIRRLSIAAQGNPYVERIGPTDSEQEARTLRTVRKLGRLIKTAFVADEELAQYIRDEFQQVIRVPQAIDLSMYPFLPPSKTSGRPLVVHAPSRRAIKGTSYVLEAVEKLSEQYDFDFVLLEGKNHAEALSVYQRADVVIDQLLLGTYGILAVESMALGKPVLSYIREDIREKYPPDLPILSCNPDNIYQQLRELLEDGEMRNQIGHKGREYVVANHDSLKVAARLVSAYGSL